MVTFNEDFPYRRYGLDIVGVVFSIVTNADVPQVDKRVVRFNLLKSTGQSFAVVWGSRVPLGKEFVMPKMGISC